MNKGLQTLLCFSSCHIKINSEKAVTSDSVFHHFFSSVHWLCTKISYTTCKAEKGEARWYRLRSFTKMWMAAWSPCMFTPIYSQHCCQDDLFKTVLIISFSKLIKHHPLQDKFQAHQYYRWPEPCGQNPASFNSSIKSSGSLRSPYYFSTVHFRATFHNHKNGAFLYSFTWWTANVLGA